VQPVTGAQCVRPSWVERGELSFAHTRLVGAAAFALVTGICRRDSEVGP
jgi:hypothetical protein